ncbi:3,4-dihydroxy-2-butanone-4-phosphate synthase [Thioclava sp. BHET1]|uniref:3,4-dihydroxy-2-butanone 4-phosphate synthase n=1 Tax=Thioclava dalianensis TaxID=1185766 RepID=A0A074U9R5_9RHOB|nr:3,4-dihydroxy-2-butanone-4-phosphate synthase [Thioclava dalianensis]KEP71427.1 3,4-dihydroxy-2-butanone 4-phosphate synthase [Thioclava dalianensis]TMV92085.1 3,4-dihydroxy-2-butanone-4-phosphate synthase [Thioclava sp. BHET1]SFM79751.1 3,4-dihydroxy 2-butanone 4-phosphate synthase / GTP cyclohydrolase II [Thioclava dalianensis]
MKTPTPVDKSGTHDVPGAVEESLRHAISPIEEIIADARAGRMVILVDHEDRENEGDLYIPAAKCTPEAVNFMAMHGRGLICLPLTAERVDQLGLAPMVRANSMRHETAFTVSIEAREGITTGISAHDRAQTVAIAIDPSKGPQNLASPGHVFPLRAREGGVLVRAGHTEAAVDIARLAGLPPAGVICEIMGDDGHMLHLPGLIAFGRQHGLKIGTISDLISYRRRHDNLVRETLSQSVNSEFGGTWQMRVFTDQAEGVDHVVLTKGDVTTPEPVLVRTHSLNILDDVLGIGTSPANEVRRAMEIVAAEGRGAVCLFRDPSAKLLREEEQGPRTIKQIGLGSQILSTMGLNELILLTDNPATRYVGLDAYGLSIVGTRPISEE